MIYAEIGDIGYTFREDNNNKELMLLDARFCAMSNVNTSLLEIPETILFDGIKYKVTKVDFSSLNRIKDCYKEIRFPDSIVQIPIYCLYCSASVEKLVFGSGITIIPHGFAEGASNLREVVFSDKLERIGNQAFRMTSIEKLILPPRLKEIGEDAFYYCSKLSKVIFPESLEIIFVNLASSSNNLTFLPVVEPSFLNLM